jgi:hypothetical protein
MNSVIEFLRCRQEFCFNNSMLSGKKSANAVRMLFVASLILLQLSYAQVDPAFWDKPFDKPQYVIHSSVVSNFRSWFLGPDPGNEYKDEYFGPFNTPREVCDCIAATGKFDMATFNLAGPSCSLMPTQTGKPTKCPPSRQLGSPKKILGNADELIKFLESMGYHKCQENSDPLPAGTVVFWDLIREEVSIETNDAKRHCTMMIGNGLSIHMGGAPPYPLTPEQAVTQRKFVSSIFMGAPEAFQSKGIKRSYKLNETWCPPQNKYFHDNNLSKWTDVSRYSDTNLIWNCYGFIGNVIYDCLKTSPQNKKDWIAVTLFPNRWIKPGSSFITRGEGRVILSDGTLVDIAPSSKLVIGGKIDPPEYILNVPPRCFMWVG